MPQDGAVTMPANTWTTFPDSQTTKVIIDLSAHYEAFRDLQEELKKAEEEVRQLTTANTLLVTLCNRLEGQVGDVREETRKECAARIRELVMTTSAQALGVGAGSLQLFADKLERGE